MLNLYIIAHLGTGTLKRNNKVNSESIGKKRRLPWRHPGECFLVPRQASLALRSALRNAKPVNVLKWKDDMCKAERFQCAHRNFVAFGCGNVYIFFQSFGYFTDRKTHACIQMLGLDVIHRNFESFDLMFHWLQSMGMLYSGLVFVSMQALLRREQFVVWN